MTKRLLWFRIRDVRYGGAAVWISVNTSELSWPSPYNIANNVVARAQVALSDGRDLPGREDLRLIRWSEETVDA